MLENNKNNKHNDASVVLIDLIPDPVVVIDSSRRIVAANKMIGKITGYNKEQLVGKSLSSLGFINEEYKKLLTEKMKGRLAGSNITPYEIEVTAKNGEVKCLRISANRFINWEKQ
jgi:PAS domain S-box-containing protein